MVLQAFVWVADRPGYRSSPVGPSPRRTRPDARHSNRAAIGRSLCDPAKQKKESPPSPSHRRRRGPAHARATAGGQAPT